MGPGTKNIISNWNLILDNISSEKKIFSIRKKFLKMGLGTKNEFLGFLFILKEFQNKNSKRMNPKFFFRILQIKTEN